MRERERESIYRINWFTDNLTSAVFNYRPMTQASVLNFTRASSMYALGYLCKNKYTKNFNFVTFFMTKNFRKHLIQVRE